MKKNNCKYCEHLKIIKVIYYGARIKDSILKEEEYMQCKINYKHNTTKDKRFPFKTTDCIYFEEAKSNAKNG